MIIYPAVDLIGGKVVRLRHGDFNQQTTYEEDPLALAQSFKARGATHMHIVDLDGARGTPSENFRTMERMIGETGLFVEVGGGFRSEERILAAKQAGAGRVILGTVAVEDPAFLKEMVARYGDFIAVGVDVKDKLVATRGWEKTSGKRGTEFCVELRDLGVDTVIYTDISKDGALSGTNLEVYGELSEIKGLSIIASGGITYEREITALSSLVSGAILGKALLDGRLSLEECIRLAETKGETK